MTADAPLVFDAALLSGGAVADFDAPAGLLTVVETGDGAAARELADAALGLQPPAAGAVRAFGRDWASTTRAEAAALRARIGVALAEDDAPPHLPALDAFALRLDWRGAVSPEARLADCARTARAFGLPGAPDAAETLAALSRADRRRLALARAFLGAPDLILIERAPDPAPPDLVAALINALLRAMARGAAALWLADPRDLAGATLPAGARRVALGRGRLEDAA